MKKRFRQITAVLLAVVLVLSLFTALPFSAAAAENKTEAVGAKVESEEVSSDDYPYSGTAAGVYIVDDWNFYRGECTSFCAWRLNNNNGVGFHNWFGGIRWGNANTWDDAARSLGYTVDNTPAVGAIAYWEGASGSTGHVAWVSNVYDGSVDIEEYNYGWVLINGEYHGNHKYNSRNISRWDPSGYIHIKDINPGPVKNAWLNINRSEIVTGESIVFSFGAENGNGLFTIGIDKGENRIYTTDTRDNSIIYTFNESGEYSAYVTAYGDGTLSDSNRVYFRVYPNVPASNAWLTIDKEIIETGQSITFSFGADNSAGIYTIGIDKDNNRIHTEDIRSNSFTYTFNEAGNYSAYVTCYGYGGLADTQRVYFNVYSYSMMDINFWVDGKEQISIDGIGTVQVYVDGQLQKQGNATSYSDYYQNVIVGKPYEVKVNITNSNYHFGGVDTFDDGYSGQTGITSADGTLVRLVIVKDSDGLTGIPDGNYLLASVIDPSYGLDIAGDAFPSSHADNVEIWEIGNTPRMQDVFTFKNLGNGYYSINQMNTNMYIDVQNASTSSLGNIVMCEWNGSDAQQWKVCYDSSSGGYTFQSKCSGMFMTIYGGNMANGANVMQVCKSVTPKSQGWKLRRLINDEMVTVSDVVIHSNTDDIIPKITVTANNNPLVKDIDYQTSIIIEIEKGKGKVIVNGINNYCNSITKEFEIRTIPFVIGDTNLDGRIDIRDVTAIQRHIAELDIFSEEQLAAADANGDGVVDINDATHLQKYLAEFNIALGKQS